jgi:hypothetical protein
MTTPQIYNHEKGCFVMRGPTEIINAFHPDYVKTHMPGFMTEFRTADARRQAAETLSGYVTAKRKVTPSHGKIEGLSKVQRETIPNQKFQDISAFPKTRESQKSLRRGAAMPIEEVAKELTAAQKAKLAPKEYHTFSKAGTANTTKVKK